VYFFNYITQKGFCDIDNENSSQPKRREKVVLSLARELRQEREGHALSRPDT